jgi:hypothetical protein
MQISCKPANLKCVAVVGGHIWNEKMPWVSTTILKGFLAIALVASLGVRSLGAPALATTAAAGTYTVKMAGCMTGTGNAALSGTTLSITGTVSDDAGHKGDFTASNLKVDAKLHFTGTGTALGLTITLSGRLDPSNPQEAALKTTRVVCTFTTSKDGHGRIVGYVPVDPGTLPPAKVPPPGDGSEPPPHPDR